MLKQIIENEVKKINGISLLKYKEYNSYIEFTIINSKETSIDIKKYDKAISKIFPKINGKRITYKRNLILNENETYAYYGFHTKIEF